MIKRINTGKGIIPTITKEQFIRTIKDRKNENISLLSDIEAQIRHRRPYVFRLPKPGSSVILLYSGGIDSTVAWYLLMKTYKLHVYPLFVAPNENSSHRKAIEYYTPLFKKEFPLEFHAPLVVVQSIVPHEFDAMFQTKNIHPDSILDLYFAPVHQLSGPFMGLSVLLMWHALYYLRHLYLIQHISIDTIFTGITANDGVWISGQSFTFQRIMMLSLITFMQKSNLQFTSLFFEKETGWFASKEQIIQISQQHKLSLHQTTSCYATETTNCGKCQGCLSRKHAFQVVGIDDGTHYRERELSTKLLLACVKKVWYSGKRYLKEVILWIQRKTRNTQNRQ